MKIGFDNDKYLQSQSEHIAQRIESFGDKLYLELGGKLFDDFHASRVLPGFQPDSKIKMLIKLKDQAEIIIAICAGDIEKNKLRGDLGIPYKEDLLRLIDSFRSRGLYVGGVVITRYSGQPAADRFRHRLEQLGIKVYLHYPIEGYPNNIPNIVSENGFGKNEYVNTERPLVIVTAPGPGSGKMAVCLSQLYHDHLRGIRAGYAKFETFPVWNLPMEHPVNIAYEAATADLNDVNAIDHYHLAAHNVMAVNYNRDLEVFPVLKDILKTIYDGECPYESPTDMGVNKVGDCIFDDEACREAAKQEIIRRYYESCCEAMKGHMKEDAVHKIERLMNKAGVTPDDRKVVKAALTRAEETGEPAAAIELPDGQLVTGKTSGLLGASAAVLLNALKVLGNINDDIMLLSPSIIEPVQKLKTQHLHNKNPRLHMDEVLIALSVSAATNETASKALEQLHKLKDCEAHSTVLLAQVDSSVFRKLGMHLTCEPEYQTKALYHK